MLPSSSVTATADADLLAHADAEIQTRLVPLLLRVQEEYLVQRLRITLVNGIDAYPLPINAIGSRVRSVMYVRSAGRLPIPRLRPEQRNVVIGTVTGFPIGFYLDGANIILVPAPQTSSGDVLEVDIYARPNRLVPAAGVGIIASHTGTTPGPFTVNFSNTVSPVFASGALLDFVFHQPPFPLLAYNVTASTGGGASVIVSDSSITSNPNVNSQPLSGVAMTTPELDYLALLGGVHVSLTGTSDLIQLPVELQPVLAQLVTARVLAAMGYLEEANRAASVADQQLEAVTFILTPRTDGNPRKVVGGVLNGINRGLGGYWRW